MQIKRTITAAAAAATLLALSVVGAKAAPSAGGLPAPAPLAPGGNVSLPVTFDWSAVPSAQWYHVQVYDFGTMQTSDFTRPAIANSYGIAFAVIPNGYLLQAGHSYGWRVAACNNEGCGPFSPASAFSVDGLPTGGVTNSGGPPLQSATIQANTTFDFRTGTSAPGSGDIYYSTVSGANYMGVTVYAAADGLHDFGLVPFRSLTSADLAAATYSAANYVDNKNGPADLKAGDVFGVSIGGGNALAEVLVVSADYNQLQIQYFVLN